MSYVINHAMLCCKSYHAMLQIMICYVVNLIYVVDLILSHMLKYLCYMIMMSC